MRSRIRVCRIVGCSALVLALAATAAWSQAPPEATGLHEKTFFKPELSINVTDRPLQDLLTLMPNRAQLEAFVGQQLAATGVQPALYVDELTGSVTSLIGSFPIIPGPGLGNSVQLATGTVDATLVGHAIRDFAATHSEVLGLDLDQLGVVRAKQATSDLWHISIPQIYRGVPVRYARFLATINRGNIVVSGTENWGNVKGLSVKPRLSADQAMAAGFAYIGGRTALDHMADMHLEIVPFTREAVRIGAGFGHALVWVISFERAPSPARWEILVNAHDGEILSFQDTTAYAEESITGGVYPLTSTEICPTDQTCGTMQSGWPMPFADTGQPAPNDFTDSAGFFESNGGAVTTMLSGRFVSIEDSDFRCGLVSSSASSGSLDLGGVNGQHDCDLGDGSPGNTAAARTAFYEVNKIIELAKGWLPDNSWLDGQLNAVVNQTFETCNAFWTGTQMIFFQSSDGCGNSGELASVLDHEWGHGLDDNDTGPFSNPSEAYADIAAIYRLHNSCLSPGFFLGPAGVCGLTADGTGPNRNEKQNGGTHCDLDCSGVRDADWDKHEDHNPDTPLNFVCTSCMGGPGPCARQVHCSAAPIRQAAWDLVTRDLPAAGFDRETSFVMGNRLFYQGSGNIGSWYSCSCGDSTAGGCGAGGGYLQWLAADDDNGNLNDGTPHMQAIFDAYDRHGIACPSPTPQNGGCLGAPASAPTLSATPGGTHASLSWSNVAGADQYWVFRTEGHQGCDFGKALIARVAGTSFVDIDVASGRDYHYNVAAAAANDACYGPLSACQTVTPTAPGPGKPTVTITAPAPDSAFDQDDTVTLVATATDPQDGDLSSSIVWRSSLDGVLGSGASVSVSGLSVGSKTTITSFVTDSDTNTDTDRINLNILNIHSECQDLLYWTGFESDEGGWVEGASTCTFGFFVRGTPNEVITEGVTTQVDGAATGVSAWYTAPNPNWPHITDVIGGTCETLSPSVAVGAGNIVSASVDYFHGQRDGGVELGDGFTIELIDADTNVVLDTLVDIGNVSLNAAWTSVSSQISSAPANVRLRVRATDAGPVDIIEAGLDNIQICSSSAGGGCTSDAQCTDGLFCNGAETCDLGTNTCQAGTAPDCSDGVSCTVDSCNEGSDSCDHSPDDGLCDNGLFCDGAETCDVTLGCQSGADPCPGGACDEQGDVCVGSDCAYDADFESGDGGWTAGADSCTSGSFIVGTPDATTWQVDGGNPGQAFFTQNNPGGIGGDDVDGGTCEALSPIIVCTGEAAARISLDYFHGQRDAGDDAGDGFTIEVLSDGSVVDTVVAHGDVTSNPAWTSVSTFVSNPGDIQVRVRATDAAGGGDIVEGGIDNVRVEAATPPTCTVDEDFENGPAGWENDNASTCTTGDYVAGNPTEQSSGGVTTQIGGSHSGVMSIFTATNSTAGNADVDGGNCILGSPSWSVGVLSTLSAWYFHGQRDAGDDAAGDFFLLEYSTNDGATWNVLASNNDAESNAGWTNSTASIPAGSDVLLRVQCSDGPGSGDIIECGIDDVSICNQ